METGIACLLVFLVMAVLMYSRKLSALLALPLMAIAISLIARIPPTDIITKVLSEGAVKLNMTYTTTMFGAMLAELLNKQGIARSLVRWVAEFAGDNPFVLAVVLTLTTAVLFSTLGGLGAVIMVGTIVLPVLLSLGITNVTAGSLFLFGISLGGMFNIASWALYIGVLGIAQGDIIAFVVPFALILSLIVLCFLAVELGGWKNWKYVIVCLLLLGAGAFALDSSHQHAGAAAQAAQQLNRRSIVITAIILVVLLVNAARRHHMNTRDNPGLALLTPLVPLVLVLFFHWDFIPAFMAGIGYGALITWKKDSINVLTRSIIDGIATVIPAVCLMIGIGMLINAVSHQAVKNSMAPLMKAVIPVHALPFIIIFTIIAPLALYRGPLSLWGMGSGLVSLVRGSTALASQAIMSMLMSVGQIQGICDPTNTHNIWIATYLGTDTQILLRKTLPYAWTAVICGLTLAVYFGYVPL